MKIGDKVRVKGLARLNDLKSDIFTVTGFGKRRDQDIVYLEAETPSPIGTNDYWEYIDRIEEI